MALWDDPQLVRTPEQAAAVVETLGAASAVVMRGNGAVVAGDSLEDAVVLTWYLEDAARMAMSLSNSLLHQWINVLQITIFIPREKRAMMLPSKPEEAIPS